MSRSFAGTMARNDSARIERRKLMSESQVKSKQRVADCCEGFAAEREVNAME